MKIILSNFTFKISVQMRSLKLIVFLLLLVGNDAWYYNADRDENGCMNEPNNPNCCKEITECKVWPSPHKDCVAYHISNKKYVSDYHYGMIYSALTQAGIKSLEFTLPIDKGCTGNFTAFNFFKYFPLFETQYNLIKKLQSIDSPPFIILSSGNRINWEHINLIVSVEIHKYRTDYYIFHPRRIEMVKRKRRNYDYDLPVSYITCEYIDKYFNEPLVVITRTDFFNEHIANYTF